MNRVIAGPKLAVLSHSQRNQLQDCPWGWYLARRARDGHGQRLKPLTAAWFDQGTAVHEALEFWEASGRTIDAVAAFHAAYKRMVYEHLDSHPEEHEWIRGGRNPKSRKQDILDRAVMGADQVAKYVAWAVEQPFKVWQLPSGEPAIEVEFRLRLGEVYVRGFIDVIWEWQTDLSVDVTDYKTGSKEPSDDEQLGLYRLAVEELIGADVAGGRYMMLRSWKHERRDLSKYTREYLTELYANAEQTIQGEVYVAKPGSGCFTCTMKRHCDQARLFF
jgi:putative RecB family exonuclease